MATDTEKLIISLLLDLHERLELNTVDVDFVRRAVLYGDDWAVRAKYPGIISDSEQRRPEDVEFVHRALGMWRVIEESYEGLSDDDKGKVQAARGAFGAAPRFEGFDGHTDLVSIARILIEDLGSYEEFAGRDLDAHQRNGDVHERMVEAYLGIIRGARFGPLSTEEIIEVVDARIHPENR